MTQQNQAFLEEQRLQRLYSFDILDTANESTFDQLADDLGAILQVPTVLISFVDRERQWFKACFQFEDRQTPREVAFCNYTILSDEPMVVEDATLDERFASNPLVTGKHHIRAYAGVPLITREGHRIGTVCCIDQQPRAFTRWDLDMLTRFARRTMAELEQRLVLKQTQALLERLEQVVMASRQGMVLLNPHGAVIGANPAAQAITGMAWTPGSFFEPRQLKRAETVLHQEVYACPQGEGYFTCTRETLTEDLQVLRLEAYGIRCSRS